MSGFFLYQYDADLVALNPVGFTGEIPAAMNQLALVSVPDGVQIDTSVIGVTAAAIIAEKLSQLDTGFGYDNAISDEFLDASQVDAAFTGHRAASGLMKHTYLQPEDSAATPGRLTTTGFAAGADVTDYTVIWDIYELDFQDSMVVENANGDRVNRLQLTQLDQSDIVVRVSADDGGTFDVVTSGAPKTPTVPGDTIRLQFETAPAETDKIWLGSWYMFFNTV